VILPEVGVSDNFFWSPHEKSIHRTKEINIKFGRIDYGFESVIAFSEDLNAL
jgi:hypothetical protein